MHGRGVVHRDIAPANIVLSGDGAPCLIDFALATTFAEIRPEFTHHSEIVGTLPYLAPEQTGRTGRPVDQRADLYALGATLYELATGAPPFGAGDPLRLIHDHLARVPVPPGEVNPAVPAPLSEIIMHLLEKEPDNRYQTAEGLVHDLERLRRRRRAAAPVRVGEHDVPPRLLPPSRLVGRDERGGGARGGVRAGAGGPLSRRAGHRRAGGRQDGAGRRAAAGRDRPATAGSWRASSTSTGGTWSPTAVYQAFRALGRLLLAEPEDELAEVRERILAALGPNAGLADRGDAGVRDAARRCRPSRAIR